MMVTSKPIYRGAPIPKSAVINIVCDELFTTLDVLTSANRTRPLPDNRKILAYCLKRYCGNWATLHNIGRVLKKDHSTVVNNLRVAENYIITDPDFLRRLSNICNKIEQNNLNTNKEMKKSVNDLLNDLVDAQVVTEGHKLLILRAVEREKAEAVNEALLTTKNPL